MKFNNRNVYLSPKAKIGPNVRIGDNSTIYDNVIIGDNTIISDNCTIGEPLVNYYREKNYINPKTIIGKDCLIRSHSIIYATNIIGNNLVTGHNIIVRSGNEIGNNCSIGNKTELHGDSKIGDYVRLHSDVCICEKSIIEDFVWIFPGTILSNGVNPPKPILIGPEIGKYSVLAVNVVVLPGVKIGSNCLIGASTLVTKNVDSYSLILGNPGRYVKDIREVKSYKTKSNCYPWPENMSNGMPWEGINFKQWEEKYYSK